MPAAMSLVVPTLLARATAEGEDQYREISSRLLELAQVDQQAFRAVVGGMGASQRAFLEEILRSGQVASAASGRDDAGPNEGQPTIALKMDFGG